LHANPARNGDPGDEDPGPAFWNARFMMRLRMARSNNLISLSGYAMLCGPLGGLAYSRFDACNSVGDLPGSWNRHSHRAAGEVFACICVEFPRDELQNRRMRGLHQCRPRPTITNNYF
jgi:hypothetical protein